MKRIEITLKFSADLDQVPGWGYEPDDWVQLVESRLAGNSHYNTKVEIEKVEVKE